MADIVTSSSPKRVPLSQAVPLEQPFAVHIFPAYRCNFRCFYCIHSLPENEFEALGHKKQLMDFEILKSAVDGCRNFKGKLKTMTFAGHGEPLVNKKLPEMIAYAASQKVAERLELVTNGSLLSEERSLALIDAGLDVLRISIQGLGSAKYKDVSGIDIDFDEFVRQIEFIFSHRRKCNIYIKIVDAALGEGEEKRFHEIFSGICDRIAVEHVVPTALGVDYTHLNDDFSKTQQGYEHKRVSVCPMPFYMMVVEPDGNVRTCCATRYPVLIGNVMENTLPDLWKSKKLRDFHTMMLKGKRFEHHVCRNCTNPDYGIQPGDLLDGHERMILDRIKKICLKGNSDEY